MAPSSICRVSHVLMAEMAMLCAAIAGSSVASLTATTFFCDLIRADSRSGAAVWVGCKRCLKKADIEFCRSVFRARI